MTQLHRERRILFKLENVLVMGMVFVLMWVVIQRMEWFMRESERVAFEITVNNLRTSLSYEITRRLADGAALNDLAALADTNPMDYAQPPKNYQGVFIAVDPQRLDPGTWHFDPNAHALVYRVRNDDIFQGSLPDPERARLHIQLKFKDADGNGQFDPDIDAFESLRLVPVEPYVWVESE